MKLIHLYIVCIILNGWNLLRSIYISLLIDLKMAIKQLRLLSVNLLSSQNVYLTRNKFVIFADSKSALQALLSKWDHPTVQTIMRFLVFLHTIRKTVICCCLPSHMEISGNERADSAVKVALQKDISECLISYNDAYQYISQYVRDLWQSEWDTTGNNKLHATKPLIGEQTYLKMCLQTKSSHLSKELDCTTLCNSFICTV